MSTRCNVQVTHEGMDWKQTVQLYHHCDGYPSNMLPLIAKGVKAAGDGWKAGRAGKLAAFIIAEEPGSFEPEEGTTPHGDIEFLYRVITVNKNGGSMAENPGVLVDVYTSWGSNHGLRQIVKREPIDKAAARAQEIEALASGG